MKLPYGYFVDSGYIGYIQNDGKYEKMLFSSESEYLAYISEEEEDDETNGGE